MRCVSDTEGNSSLLSRPLNIFSDLLFSSLSGASALPGGRRSFSVRDLWSRHQVTGKLTVMLEDNSCLFESHSSSHVSRDPEDHCSFLGRVVHSPQKVCSRTEMIYGRILQRMWFASADLHKSLTCDKEIKHKSMYWLTLLFYFLFVCFFRIMLNGQCQDISRGYGC